VTCPAKLRVSEVETRGAGTEEIVVRLWFGTSNKQNILVPIVCTN